MGIYNVWPVIMFWNANGIQKDKTELIECIRHNHVKITLVNETHLKVGQKFKVANHSVYRNDRLSKIASGGTAIIIDRTIQHYEIDLPVLNSIEANSIIIDTAQGKLRLIAAYKKPSATLDTTDLDKIFADMTPTILAGDLNCKHSSWNSRTTNSNGKILYQHCELTNTYSIFGPDTPTIYPSNNTRPDIIDIVLTNNIVVPFCLDVINAMNSDHNPVLLTYGSAPLLDEPPSRINTKKTDWRSFQQHLDQLIITGNPTIVSKTDIDKSLLLLTSSILCAIQKSTPSQKSSRIRDFNLPKHILALIKNKNRLRKQWQKYRDANDKKELNIQTRVIKELIRQHNNDTWREKVEHLNSQDLSLWRMTKALLKIPDKCPSLHGTNGIVYSNIDKANALADTLETTFKPNNDPSDDDKIDEVERSLFNLAHLQTPIIERELCSPKEILGHIIKLNNKKAPGLDGVPNESLKYLSRKGITFLTKIFNSMIKHQYFSASLKKSKIILFSKPGKDPKFPQNYRPISLLTALSKLFERIILTRLNHHLNTHNILRNEQFGFRQSHSTSHQLLRITDSIIDGFNRNQVTGVVFLDISQAFDKVWHEGLIHKLMQYNFPPYLIHIIKSYLTNRTFEVHLQGAISSVRSIEAGVPQGSVLGPTLFNIYINDMPSIPRIEIALYADDTALIAKSMRGFQACNYLQNALDILEEWYSDWRIKINVSKSSGTIFTRKSKLHSTSIPISLFDENIPWSKTSKYLGVTMDHRLTWAPHITELSKKCNQRIALLKPLIGKSNHIDTSVGILLYKTLILPIMTYAGPVWAGTAKTTNINKLEIIQNKTIRRITKDPWFIRNSDIRKDFKIKTVLETIKKLSVDFYNKLNKIPNPLIKNLGDYDQSQATYYGHIRPKIIINR